MIKPAIIVTAVILLFAAGGVVAEDLYLLSINSATELSEAHQVIDHAHGRLGDDFIVELNDSLFESLSKAGLSIHPAGENISLDRVYILSPISGRVLKSAIYVPTLAVSEAVQLAELNDADVEIIRKSGYMAVPVAGLETPLFYNPPMMAAMFEDIYPLDTLADYVSQDSLYSYDTRLEQFYTRYITSDSINHARDYLVGKFLEFGYTDVYTDTFDAFGYDCHNVICFKPGSVEPDKIIVIGGHYDSYNGETDPWIFAPGADDNASGTSIALEMARVFKDVDNKKSLLFAAFSAEEVGLLGSDYLAWTLYNQGADLECMLNFDMVAYNPDAFENVGLFTNSSPVYSFVMRDAATRVTTLIPSLGGSSGSSDHASFANYGFQVAYAQEGDFNFDGWHTNIDISSRLNFPYLEQVGRMTAAAIGHIDRAAGVTPIDDILDVGDGQGLRLVWNSCNPSYTYKVLVGSAPSEYTDTLDVAPAECSYDLTGLNTGEIYYFTLLGINSEGAGPLYLIEDSGASFIEPRAPKGLALEPEYQKIMLDWTPNREMDLNHYRVLRRQQGGGWSIIADDVTDAWYDDLSAVGHVSFEYMILAVDNDLIESDSSIVVGGMAATFDYPMLFVDETASSGFPNPSSTEQAAFYDSIFADIWYDTYFVGSDPDRIDRTTSGQYKNMFWFDDDLSVQLFAASLDTVNWFLNYETNFLLAGWQTLYYIAGGVPLGPGDFVYDNFRISEVEINTLFEFTGATGLNGWPDLQVRSSTFGGLLPSISTMQTAAGGEAIYTYNASNGNPEFDGQPAGVVYDTGAGKRIALGFPIYHLTEASAEALMAKVNDYFGIEPFVLYGDINGDENINLMDIIFLINYLYKGGPAPSSINNADVNGSCSVNVLDVSYMVDYLYRGGPQPQPGCVE